MRRQPRYLSGKNTQKRKAEEDTGRITEDLSSRTKKKTEPLKGDEKGCAEMVGVGCAAEDMVNSDKIMGKRKNTEK